MSTSVSPAPNRPSPASPLQPQANAEFARGLARAFGGALIFSLPLLQTMEMWQLGFYIDHLHLALLLVLVIPLLIGLSHFIGFEATFRLKDDMVDAFVAYAVGYTTAALVLFLFGVIELNNMPTGELTGKIALQSVPGSIGALLAQSQFGAEGSRSQRAQWRQQPSYACELFLMAVGALLLALPVAPTEEMVLIAHRMSPWRTVALALVSVLIMHAFVYAAGFRRQHVVAPNTPRGSLFLRFTVVGYAIVLLISLYILWTFGRIEGSDVLDSLSVVTVLAFPAAIGAAAARLIL
jgi:putative integral membrane protein (TIGR02587 family)